MQINQSNQLSFQGKFSPKTLSKFKENLSPREFERVKNFRAGGRYTNFDIRTEGRQPLRMPNGSVILPKETFVEFSNARKPNSAHGRILLANGELPFNMDMFRLITKDLVAKGESLMKMFK